MPTNYHSTTFQKEFVQHLLSTQRMSTNFHSTTLQKEFVQHLLPDVFKAVKDLGEKKGDVSKAGEELSETWYEESSECVLNLTQLLCRRCRGAALSAT